VRSRGLAATLSGVTRIFAVVEIIHTVADAVPIAVVRIVIGTGITPIWIAIAISVVGVWEAGAQVVRVADPI
jgi:hypothetical protein